MEALRTVRGAIPQDVVDQGLVGEAQDVVEILSCVLGIAARVRTAKNRHRAFRAELAAQRVGEERGLGEGADEDDVDVVGKLVGEVLEPRVADVGHLVPARLAPDADDLRHDAGQVRVHHPRIEGVGGSFGDEIDDADAELTHPSLVS